MKKKQTNEVWRIPILFKILRIMRLTLGLLFALALQGWATSAYSQKTVLNLDMKNVKIVDVLEEIEDQTDYYFLFNYEQINADKRISVNLTNAGIEETLNSVLQGTGLKYAIKDRQIVISKDESRMPEQFDTSFTQQLRTISGTVTGSNSDPVPGVTITVKGTTRGTVSDAGGNFTLTNMRDNEILVFSFIGMKTLEIPVAGQSFLNVVMEDAMIGVEEVVVTAFGLEREKRALGYSVGSISGEAISAIRDPNILNNLAARVPGVSVKSLSADAGSSVNVEIRGAKNFSPTGNQPLYIVDGVPISGDIRFNGASDRNVDYGNASFDINPDDVANISVLKGANAAALYGSRAGNGVILIETKSGKQAKKGLGVEIASSYMLDDPFLFPDFQYEFGQGLYNNFTKTTLEAWGPALNKGIKAIQYNSPIDETGKPVPSELKSYARNTERFLQTASTLTNTVAITHKGDNSNIRVSFTDMQYEGIVPNTDLERNTFYAGGGFNASDKFRVNFNVSFNQTRSKNRPVDASSKSNIIQLLYRELPPNINVTDLENYWVPGQEEIQQFQTYGSGTNNPYFAAHENLHGMRLNRLTGTVELTYMLTPNLSVKGRATANITDEKREERQAFSSVQYPKGYYSVGKSSFQELNTDLMLGYKAKAGEDWFFSVDAGTNFMRQYDNSIDGGISGGMVVPGMYTLSNYDSQGGVPGVSSGYREKEIHSVLGLGQIAWRESIYMDVTARNDWSSTLPVNNNSYFYPSLSFSAILSEFLRMPAWVSLLKARAGWAEVGKDTAPYQLSNSYSFGTDWNGVKNVYLGLGLPPFDLQPEKLTSNEYGIDIALFKGRVNLDATYYETVNKNQIFAQVLSHATGFAGKVINAGRIENKGLEIGLNLVPVKKAVRWDVGINYTRNRNKIVELGPNDTDESFLQLASTRNVKIYGYKGGSTSAIYTRGIERDENNNPLTNNGIYKIVGEYRFYRGDYNPDFQVGFVNFLSYKQFSLEALVDWRNGGTVVDANGAAIANNGYTKETLAGRDAGHGGLDWIDGQGNLRHDGMIVPGTDQQTGQPNQVIIPAQDYYKSVYDLSTYPEFLTHTGTFVKLRQVSLSYSLPANLTKNLFGIQRAVISLQGKNLFLWTRDDLDFDPENAFSSTGGTFAGGVNFEKLPATRSYGIKLQVVF